MYIYLTILSFGLPCTAGTQTNEEEVGLMAITIYGNAINFAATVLFAGIYAKVLLT
jgi:hypothetical protein